jgi:hypothetical protein
LFVSWEAGVGFLAVDPLGEGASGSEELPFSSGGLEGFKGEEPLGSAKFVTEGIGGAAGEVMSLVNDQAGAGGVESVSVFKDAAARGVKDVVHVSNPDLRVGQATFG